MLSSALPKYTTEDNQEIKRHIDTLNLYLLRKFSTVSCQVD